VLADAFLVRSQRPRTKKRSRVEPIKRHSIRTTIAISQSDKSNGRDSGFALARPMLVSSRSRDQTRRSGLVRERSTKRSETGQAGLTSHGRRDVGGCLFDEIQNLVEPIERRYMSVSAGPQRGRVSRTRRTPAPWSARWTAAEQDSAALRCEWAGPRRRNTPTALLVHPCLLAFGLSVHPTMRRQAFGRVYFAVADEAATCSLEEICARLF
jgi:hypothetical protein